MSTSSREVVPYASVSRSGHMEIMEAIAAAYGVHVRVYERNDGTFEAVAPPGQHISPYQIEEMRHGIDLSSVCRLGAPQLQVDGNRLRVSFTPRPSALPDTQEYFDSGLE